MYCMLEIRNGKIQHLQSITSDCIIELKESIHNSQEVIDVVNGFSFIKDALMDLEVWCREADQGSENLHRNMHTAEQYVRGFLFEFRTYLNHLEKHLVREYGAFTL